MITRIFDVCVALIGLIVTAPLLLFAAIGILVSSRGPVFYQAARIGKDAKPFRMIKFRTMRVAAGGPVITAGRDPRIFWFGNLLRKIKIDELPQLVNVLIGQMALVGPRPEAPEIVQSAYTDWMMETLRVRPGVTSPGSLYYYATAEDQIAQDDPETHYINDVMPEKLAIDRAYLERRTFTRDLGVLLRTAKTIALLLAGRPVAINETDVRSAMPWHQLARHQNRQLGPSGLPEPEQTIGTEHDIEI